MGASSTGRVAVLNVFRELRAVVSGEQRENYVLPRRVGGPSMKTLSRIFAFVVLAVIVIVAAVGCATYQIVANQKYFLVIGTHTTYVEWRDQDLFDKALDRVRRRGGYYDITVLKNGAGAQPVHPYVPRSIRTVKVTKSKVADGAAAGESATNDPNVTYKVATAYKEDIDAVLNALK